MASRKQKSPSFSYETAPYTGWIFFSYFFFFFFVISSFLIA